ncbi:hypothetical protein CRG98_026952 [Punica granatum]|nr:hypothetical protein CRG98_026952 [Punica granatum]
MEKKAGYSIGNSNKEEASASNSAGKEISCQENYMDEQRMVTAMVIRVWNDAEPVLEELIHLNFLGNKNVPDSMKILEDVLNYEVRQHEISHYRDRTPLFSTQRNSQDSGGC